MTVEKQSASIYANSDFICIRTSSGLGLTGADPEGELIFLKSEAMPEVIGAALFAALAKSRTLSPSEANAFFSLGAVKRRYEDWVSTVMANYSYPSRRKMFKALKNVSAVISGDTLALEPTRHDKLESWSGDEISDHEHVKISVTSSATEVGEGVLLALSRCRD